MLMLLFAWHECRDDGAEKAAGQCAIFRIRVQADAARLGALQLNQETAAGWAVCPGWRAGP
jgi:hypothetical protein